MNIIDTIEKEQMKKDVPRFGVGGTMAACCKLVESMGGNVVSCAFVIERPF